LYICLCGFPPFSDELYTPENPYTLPQQILGGRYDFPSPYWDSVGDPALDLIDRMLTVDPDERITIDECLEHPWTTGHDMGPAGESIMSTDGLLAGRMDKLDFSKRKPKRERTLLSEMNNVLIRKELEDVGTAPQRNNPVTVYAKNPDNQPGHVAKGADADAGGGAEGPGVSGARFLATGNGGDEQLFAEDVDSRYTPDDSQPRLL
jgi:serine/threonine-protein kinase Chk2